MEIQDIDANNVMYMFFDRKRKCTNVIMYDKERYCYEQRCKKILELLCLKYGSTLEGRTVFFANALQIHRKIPILISERYEIMLFPLYGMRNDEAMYIAFNQVKKIHNEENLTTMICFRNDVTIRVRMNYRSIQAQMKRCKRMIKLLNDL